MKLILIIISIVSKLYQNNIKCMKNSIISVVNIKISMSYFTAFFFFFNEFLETRCPFYTDSTRDSTCGSRAGLGAAGA